MMLGGDAGGEKGKILPAARSVTYLDCFSRLRVNAAVRPWVGCFAGEASMPASGARTPHLCDHVLPRSIFHGLSETDVLSQPACPQDSVAAPFNSSGGERISHDTLLTVRISPRRLQATSLRLSCRVSRLWRAMIPIARSGSHAV